MGGGAVDSERWSSSFCGFDWTGILVAFSVCRVYSGKEDSGYILDEVK